jgi:hypothetical protein
MLSAALASGEVVRVYRDGAYLGNATVTGTDWIFNDSGVTDGATYVYSAQVMDTAGNLSATSSTLTLTIDANKAPVLSYLDNVQSDNFNALDVDNDSVLNNLDVDDDNDGILDTTEQNIGFTANNFVTSGSATSIGGNEWQLTPNAVAQKGSINSNTRVDFTKDFVFSISAYLGTNDAGADGLAVFFHNDPAGNAATGLSGGGLGASGIVNGIAIALDTYQNGSEPASDFVSIFDTHSNAVLSTAQNVSNLENGAWHPVAVSWNATTRTLQVNVDGVLRATLTEDVINTRFGGSNLAYFGASAATGSATNDQRVRFISFIGDTDSDGDGLVNRLDSDSDNDGIVDNVEAQTKAGYIAPSGVDATHNGLDDAYAATGLTPVNTDVLDNPDYLDNDSNNDGTLDIATRHDGQPTSATSTTDTDHDGLLDIFEGVVTTASFTHDTSPIIKGALTEALQPGDVVKVYRDGTLSGTATVNGTDWTYADTGLTDGTTYVYSAKVVDALGHSSLASSTITITVDSTAPTTTAAVISYADNVGLITDAASTAATTDDTSPTIHGTLDAALASGETVNVYSSGRYVGQATVSGMDWTFADSGLSDGSTYAYTAKVADAAGNESAAGTALSVTIDTTSPTKTVAVTSYNDNVGSVTNATSTAATTDDTAPVINGTLSATLVAGEVVNVYRDGTLVGIATVGGNAWTFADSGLTNGSAYIYTAKVADAAGNESVVGAPLNITIDTTAPIVTAPVVSYTDNNIPADKIDLIVQTFGSGTGRASFASAGVIATTSYIYSAGAVPDGDYTLSNTVSGLETWWASANVTSPSAQDLAFRDHTGDVNGRFLAVNASTAPGEFYRQPITVSDAGDYKVAAFLASANNAPINANVTIKIVDSLGNVVASINTGDLPDYTNAASAWKEYSLMANLPAGSYNFVLVNNAPGGGGNDIFIDDISFSYMGVNAISGITGTAAVTNDTSPVINGTLTTALGNGEVVNVYRDGVKVGTATVSGNAWTFADSGLIDGTTYIYTAKVADPAGNETVTGTAFTMTVDTIAPTATATITSYADNVGGVKNIASTAPTTDDTSPVINGTLSAPLAVGEVANVYRGTTLVGTATVDGLTWTYDDSGLANSTTYAYKARVADAAGNVSATSVALNITLDPPLQAPTALNLAATDDWESVTTLNYTGTDNFTQQTDLLSFDGANGTNGATLTLFDDANNNNVVDAGETLSTQVLTTTGAWTAPDVSISTAAIHHIKAIQSVDGVYGLASAALNVANALPTATTQTVAVTGDYKLRMSDFSFADIDGGSLSAVQINSGSHLYLDGVLISGVTTVTASQIISGALEWLRLTSILVQR